MAGLQSVVAAPTRRWLLAASPTAGAALLLGREALGAQERGGGGLAAQELAQEVGGVAGAARPQDDVPVAQARGGGERVRLEDGGPHVRGVHVRPQVACRRGCVGERKSGERRGSVDR